MLRSINWSGRCRLTFRWEGGLLGSWGETVLWMALARKMGGGLEGGGGINKDGWMAFFCGGEFIF